MTLINQQETPHKCGVLKYLLPEYVRALCIGDLLTLPRDAWQNSYLNLSLHTWSKGEHGPEQ